MKKLFLVALVLTGFMAKAQYFQHTYGTQSPDLISSGFKVIAPAPIGHFIAGWTKSPCLPPLATITAAYTDANGNIPGGPFFERTYTLMTNTGQMLHARDAKSFQIPNAFGFGIMGMYVDMSVPGPNNTGIYFLQLGGAGNPLATYNYVPIPGFNVIEVGGVAPSVVNPNDVFVTGTVTDALGIAYPFAMRINMFTGVPVWTQIYNLLAPANGAWGKDIEENPSLPPTPFPFQAAAIVGFFNNAAAPGTTDGYLLHIDATTGAPAPAPVMVIGMPPSNEAVNSINQALPSATIPIPGYVLGGTTDFAGNQDFIFVRMDFLLGPLLFNSYDYSFLPGTNNECFDAIQRFNTFGLDEYYLAGRTSPGVFGNTDALVIKIDQNGIPVPGGEFTYGGPNFDMAQALSQDNIGAPGPPGGLGVYGSSDFFGPGQLDLYAVKAYFNGVSGCNEIFGTAIQLPFPPPLPMMPANPIGNINQMPNLNQGFIGIFDNTLCFAPVIGTGSNAFVAPADPNKGKAMLLMPNPAETASPVTLQVESEVEGSADVEIYDMLGKLYYSEKHVLKKGKNNLPIDISGAAMASGIYNVKIHGATENQTIQLMVK